MEKIDKQKIKLKQHIDESYDIFFGENLFLFIVKWIKKNSSEKRIVIITDSNVAELYSDKLKAEFNKENMKTEVFIFPAGEHSKNLETAMKIIAELSLKGFGRDSLVIAFGGGVTGDLAGFIAGIFNRGVDYIQVPTTILAQADSSLGGKTGVNTAYGKNLLGVIKQPKAVFIDANVIKTLPAQEIRNGLAESIKHAVIKDKHFFEWIEKNLEEIMAAKPPAILTLARYNCKIKGEVVEKDPNEKNLRKILNYGHTIGHAIEHLMNKQGKEVYPHGYAVSIGMMLAARLAIALKTGFKQADLEKQEQLLKKASLPIKIPREIQNEEILKVISLDKKAKNGNALFCLPSSIGKMAVFDGEYSTIADKNLILRLLDETR
jgi:3-dehydroquinate synthase